MRFDHVLLRPTRGIYSTHLLPQSHDLEALKVSEVPSPLLLSLLLRERALAPLLVDLVLLPQFADGTGAGGAGEFSDDEGSERDVGEGDRLTGNDLVLVAGRTIDQDL